MGKALSQNDAGALLELYAPDAVIESPLIPHLLGKQEGVCRGRDEMRPFFEAVAARKPPVRQYHRTGYLTDGKRLMFEYPGAALALQVIGRSEAAHTEFVAASALDPKLTTR